MQKTFGLGAFHSESARNADLVDPLHLAMRTLIS